MLQEIETPSDRGTRRELVAADGDRIAVTRVGSGRPVVCLHATGHGARDFARLAERLKGDFEFLMLDWPGHGDSSPGSRPASAERYAELLAAVLEQLRISRAVVLGNSIGGAAAIAFAARHPERVRGLVLCNPGGLQRVGSIGRFVCRRMAAFFRTGERGAANFPARFRRYYERQVLPTAAARWRREEIIQSAPQTVRALREAWESFALPAADLRHLAPAISCPVLFAWATGDRYVAWSRSRRAALSFPQHRVSHFPGGHAAFLEEPDCFVEVFTAFAGGLQE